MYCNGARLNGDFMKKVIDAGIDFIRFSMIGYNPKVYQKWMDIDNFNLIFVILLKQRNMLRKLTAHVN